MNKKSVIRGFAPFGLIATSVLSGCGGVETALQRWDQVDVDARASQILTVDGYRFKDLNKNASLDAYEDWRLSTEQRVEDLLSRMSLEEKAGMMLIDTLNADFGGKLSSTAVEYVRDEKMTRFIFRNPIAENPDPAAANPWSGSQISVYEAAQFLNSAQELAESTRLGIPLLFKSNPRNHVEPDARFGINAEAGSLSAWPKPAGLAATGDMGLVAEFAEVVRREWTAIGIRGMYGYTADLATEPRWYRVHETVSEDADLVADFMVALVESLQGGELNERSVALTMKHFPGGGPQENGGDPHYAFGKNQVYPADNFDYHFKPFAAAIDSGLAAIMPYYGIPVDQDYQPNDVGMAFSKGIITELLRDRLGFGGVVNSDTGIITERAWGLEDKSVAERLVIAIEAGNDVLSGFHENADIADLVHQGLLPESRLDESVRRLLTVQFELGLFENPYVDPDRASYLVGNADFSRQAAAAQRKSIVLLQNDNQLLPLNFASEQPLHLYVLGIDADEFDRDGWTVQTTHGDEDEALADVPDDIDAALVRVMVSNAGADAALMFGGANEDELNMLSFTEMASATSWHISPSLEQIQSVMDQVGAKRTVLSIYFRQPYVLDETSGMRDAGAILATFGVYPDAILDVVSGDFNPGGKLPFALANSAEAIIRQAPDAPGYDEADTLFPFGYGISY